jgi:diacylglycerol kinase family enzyme
MSAMTGRPSPARRFAAAGALLLAAAAIAVGIVMLIRHPLELVLVVVFVAIAITAACTALVHRGFVRVVATTVAVIAVAATFLLPDLRTYLDLLLVIGLSVLSVAAARFALGPTPGATTVRVPPARHGVLLMNPKSGGGKVERFELVRRAKELGVTPVLLGPDDDLKALAERAAADADVIGMAGGDGSQALVADIARRHGLPFVCIPAGTRNHFALDLGLDRTDVPAALAAFGEAVERRIDLAVLGDRVFVNNASLGVYAVVVRSPEYRNAKVATVAQQLPDLLGPDADRPDLRFHFPDGTWQSTADVLLVSNGAYRLEHVNGFGSRERLDAGQLGIVTVTVDRTRDVPALVSAELTGMVARFRGYRSWQAAEFVVDSGMALVDVGVDGEALRLPPPLRFRTLPGALRVRVPLDTPGGPPALPPRRSTVGWLWRVLIGQTSASSGTRSAAGDGAGRSTTATTTSAASAAIADTT